MEFKISYTDKEITPWGGMYLLKQMLKEIGFRNVMSNCPDLPTPGSNRGYSPIVILESFLVSIWSGANRFLHTEITRHDKVLSDIFDWKQAPGQDTFKRFFNKFTQALNQRVSDYLYSWTFDSIKFDNYTMDCDSSVMTRYGSQEGAKKGYNPQKRGRASHHPIMAFISDVKMVANFWLRSGNTSSSEGFVAFLEDTFQKLKNKTIGLLRLDSGFYCKEVLDYIEQREKPINYIVAVKFYEPVQRMIASEQKWLPVDDGIEISESLYQSPAWEKPRRVVMVRQRIKQRPKAAGRTLKLFKDEEFYRQYRYSAYVTNITLPAVEIWRLYRARGDAENRIKELKYDFGFDSFNLNNFYATEAALTMAMLAYNLMSLFRLFILNSKTQHTLSTLRYKVFAIGAYFEKEKGQYILRLALHQKRREWFTGLWNNTNNIKLPLIFSNA
jgi:hypothetical protein